MRKRVWIPLGIVAVATLGFFGFAPAYLESSINRVDGKPLAPVSAEVIGPTVDPHGRSDRTTNRWTGTPACSQASSNAAAPTASVAYRSWLLIFRTGPPFIAMRWFGSCLSG